MNSSLQVECDKMILSYFATPAAVGVYSLASRLMDGAFSPPRALRISLQARMMREGAKGHQAAYRFMLRIVPISVAYGFFAWAAIALLAPLFIHIFGEEYSELVRILPLMGALAAAALDRRHRRGAFRRLGQGGLEHDHPARDDGDAHRHRRPADQECGHRRRGGIGADRNDACGVDLLDGGLCSQPA